ncbi:F-box/LRR-repeat protein [Nymphaea thermarum]|nr:F-box/LRR-repeat protein [Nymphaea thermarum]
MECLPVEVIGNILSRVGAARDVVVASATCRKWREAGRNHLRALSFNSADWPVYRELSASRLEILITQTIFQTKGLQSLSISMADVADEFSAAPVIAWLMYTRDSLRSLLHLVRTAPPVNVLERCGRSRLEALVLGFTSISGVEPSYQRFPCLRFLALHSVSVSALDLSLLLSACPLIESFSLVSPDIAMSDSQATMELSSPTLKRIYVEAISLDKFVLDADSLESLHLKNSTLEYFELVGKGGLRHLRFDDVSVIQLDIGDTADYLEVVDVNDFTIVWPKFYQTITRSAKLRRLRLWGVVFDVEDEVLDLETIAVCFPRLSHLSLSYETRDSLVHYGLHGSTMLENVVALELGSTVINDLFTEWVAGLLERCPNLKKLVIHGTISEMKTREECQTLAGFTSSIVRLMRKYINVDVQFEYQ